MEELERVLSKRPSRRDARLMRMQYQESRERRLRCWTAVSTSEAGRGTEDKDVPAKFSY